MKPNFNKITRTNVYRRFISKSTTAKKPVTAAEAQSDFFWKMIEVVLGASFGFALHNLISWTAENHDWKPFGVFLALWALNGLLAYHNAKRAIAFYKRWQDAVLQNR